jgi:hypothetical protein
MQLARESGALLVFVSARPEDYRIETEQWLRANYMSRMMQPHHAPEGGQASGY